MKEEGWCSIGNTLWFVCITNWKWYLGVIKMGWTNVSRNIWFCCYWNL